MGKKLEQLIKKIFLGSIAGIASATPGYGVVMPKDFNMQNNSAEVLAFNDTKDLTPKLILKQTNSDEWAFMAHRSHRSHSSHRSHYSHYSSSTSDTLRRPAGTNTGLQSGSRSSSSAAPRNNPQAVTLGSRVLKIGMSGADVTELVNLLLKKNYLSLQNGQTSVTGIYTFDQIIEDAVKDFQRDNSITPDGVCGTATIYKLKNN